MIFDCDRVTSGFLHCIANFEEFVWGWQGDCETGEGIYVNINWTTKKCSVLSTASACTTHISAIKWTNEVKIVLIYRLKFHVPMHFLWHYSTITAHRRCYMAARRYEVYFRVVKAMLKNKRPPKMSSSGDRLRELRLYWVKVLPY